MNDVESRKEVCAHFGSAAYYAQCFEAELVILLLCLNRLQQPSLSRRELDDLDDQLSKQNLGRLLNELKRHLLLSSEFEALLRDYIAKRNYLMHRFFLENSTKLLSRTGCGELIAELQGVAAQLREADQVAQAMSSKARAMAGISEEQMQRYVGEYLEREKKRVSNGNE
jgi:hypothetical protein